MSKFSLLILTRFTKYSSTVVLFVHSTLHDLQWKMKLAKYKMKKFSTKNVTESKIIIYNVRFNWKSDKEINHIKIYKKKVNQVKIHKKDIIQ